MQSPTLNYYYCYLYLPPLPHSLLHAFTTNQTNSMNHQLEDVDISIFFSSWCKKTSNPPFFTKPFLLTLILLCSLLGFSNKRDQTRKLPQGTDFCVYLSAVVSLSIRFRLVVFCFLLMADSDSESVSEWIEKVKSEGSIPLLEPDNCPNGWATPPGDAFMVRGPDYLSTKVKIRGGEYLLKPLGFDWIRGASKISEVLNNPNGRVRKALDDELTKGIKPFICAFNLQLPSRDNYSVIAYFVALEPIEEGSLMDRFVKGDEAFRNSRLKLIANIVTGPWIVRTAVGEQAICILGRAVSCKYIVGEHFIEVDIDVGASMVANAIVHLAFGYITTLTVDLAFLIEGQSETELPERILGAVRFSELNAASAGVYDFPPEESSGNLQSSLSTRLLKSIGLDFSHLIHPGTQDGAASPSSNTNGSFNGKDKNEDAE